MSKIEFIYMQNHYYMEYPQKKDSFLNLLNKYSSLINKNINELGFLYKGKYLSLKNNINIISRFKNKKILVLNLNLKKNNNNSNLNHILCQKCNSLSILKNADDLFSIKCFNNHKYKDITIDSLIDNQIIDDSNIACKICGNIKNYYNKFYKCSNGDNICPICSQNYESNLIDYNDRFYFCIKHNMKYISYCKECNINLCIKCEEGHKVHKNKIKIFKDIKPNNKRIVDLKNEELKINKCKEELKVIKNYINNGIDYTIKNLDKYNIVYKYMINCMKYLGNYESINNVLNFDSKTIIKFINFILNENNINNKINQILNIYDNRKNEMTIIYKNIHNFTDYSLFYDSFIKNNEDKCYLLCKNKIFYLNEYSSSKENDLTIKLIENKKITNMSYMFYFCGSLFSLPDISNWNTTNVTDMNNMFSYSSLSYLPDALNWNTINVKDMHFMFSSCKLLSSLPDISKWNIKNVTSLGYMFSGCESLISLPDISNWNTINVKEMDGMFSHLKLLSSLPDISKWNIKNAFNLNHLFDECSSLKSLPDISNWNTSNVKGMSNMFSECKSLISLPDISNWNTSNVYDMGCMFKGCSSLLSLPNIEKWNISNILPPYKMFEGCSESLIIPKKFVYH